MQDYCSRLVAKLKKINYKINSIALFTLLVPVFSFSQTVLPGELVAEIPTKIILSENGNTNTFISYKMNLSEALKEKEVEIFDKDAVFPEKEMALKGGDLPVKIVRALPILLEDEGKRSIIFSGYEDAEIVLKQNKIEIFSEDKIESAVVNDFYNEKSVGQKITIKRAPVIKINVDGESKTVRSWAKNVSEVLREKGVLVGDKDKIEPEGGSEILKNMEITITRVAESEVKEDVAIEFSEKVIEDPNTFIGKDFVKQKGVNGLKENTYKIISENGAMISKSLINTEVIKEAVGQIKVKGTKPYNATTLWPTIVAASEQFGVSASKMHSVMICESGGNPYAGGYYLGLFQYHPDTWAGASNSYPGGAYAGASIYDPTAQIYVTAWKVSRQGWGAWGCA